MVRIELTLEVARAPEDVFAFLIDVDRLPEWQASALESHADAQLAVGTRIRERRRLMGRELDNELEVVAYDPPRRLTLKALGGPVRFTVDHRLEEQAGSTLLHVVAEGQAGGLMKFAEPMIARTAEEEFHKDFDRLKEMLETG